MVVILLGFTVALFKQNPFLSLYLPWRTIGSNYCMESGLHVVCLLHVIFPVNLRLMETEPLCFLFFKIIFWPFLFDRIVDRQGTG